MTDIRNSIKTIRSRIVANNSKISKNKVTDDSVIKDLQGEVYCEWGNFLGKISITPVGDFKCRQVENGKDTYYVAEGYKKMQRDVFFGNPKSITPAKVETFVRSFVVKHGEDVESLNIMSNKTISEGDESVNPTEVFLGEKRYKLNFDTDISDINQVRYQLRDIKDVSYFLDKFVIVSDKEKQAYRKYEAERLKEERHNKLKRRVGKVTETIDVIRNTRNKYNAENNEKKEAALNNKRREYFVGRQ